MKTMIEVFDPAMCCSTGVCGPSVDPALASFAATLGWVRDQGVDVVRYNLSQEPGAFAERDAVRELLVEQGDGALPAVFVDGVLCSSGRYPSCDEVAAWALGDAATYETDATGDDKTARALADADGCCASGSEVPVQLQTRAHFGVAATNSSNCCG